MKQKWRMQLGYGLLACGLSLTFSVIPAASAPSDSISATKSAKSTTPEKKTAYSGDPARKRGMELGHDYGLKAGKEDKTKNAPPNPQAHEAFKDPNKYYRYEFGSRASFVSGFKSGFLGGYQQALGKKVTVKAESIPSDGTASAVPKGTASTVPKGTASAVPKGTASAAPKKSTSSPRPPANPAADAL
jgi:hypothetical protein